MTKKKKINKMEKVEAKLRDLRKIYEEHIVGAMQREFWCIAENESEFYKALHEIENELEKFKK